MNGLVGYGSSDEDDEVSQAKTSPKLEAAITDGHEHDSGVDSTNSVSTMADIDRNVLVNSTDTPAIGPSLPAKADVSDEAEEDTTFIDPSMPEADLLRYLTQPSHPNASLPRSMTSDASTRATASFQHFLNLKSQGSHFNENLAGKSSFRNPNLFALLMERAGLSSDAQYRSTLVEDAAMQTLPPWAYKEELLRSQRVQEAALSAAKKKQSASGNRTIDFVPSYKNASVGQG